MKSRHVRDPEARVNRDGDEVRKVLPGPAAIVTIDPSDRALLFAQTQFLAVVVLAGIVHPL